MITEHELARQVAPQPLPDWTMVTKELAALLTQFFRCVLKTL